MSPGLADERLAFCISGSQCEAHCKTQSQGVLIRSHPVLCSWLRLACPARFRQFRSEAAERVEPELRDVVQIGVSPVITSWTLLYCSLNILRACLRGCCVVGPEVEPIVDQIVHKGGVSRLGCITVQKSDLPCMALHALLHRISAVHGIIHWLQWCDLAGRSDPTRSRVPSIHIPSMDFDSDASSGGGVDDNGLDCVRKLCSRFTCRLRRDLLVGIDARSRRHQTAKKAAAELQKWRFAKDIEPKSTGCRRIRASSKILPRFSNAVGFND